ncbi:DegT/DnrJ/EryC1/StrS family aminotransferase [Patescibacteria group bacterium]|nr:DegT/DnrJ/EryC1/StrS family aminotransferase [Patescibacteria group bacterium]
MKPDYPAILGGKPAVSLAHPHFDWPIISQKDIKAVVKQLKSGEISLAGQEGIIKKFEDRFKKYIGTKYALATSSGTAALHTAFFACGIGQGDEVIAPTYTFLATVTPILHCLGRPVLADCDFRTGCIDPQDIKKRITKKTKAIAVTHIWGHPCQMNEIRKIAKKHKLYLIEDCSHAHGAKYQGKKVGTLSDVAIFSLQGKKVLPAGEGGILLTNNKEILERSILFGHYGKRPKQQVKSKFYRQFIKTGYGLKLRMHPLAAALANSQLDNLPKWIKSRQQNLNHFSQGLAKIPGITPPFTEKGMNRGAFYGYKPMYQPGELGGLRKDIYIQALQAEGVEVHQPGSKPLHLLPLFQVQKDGMYNNCLQKKLYKAGDLPVAEKFFEDSLSLPTFTKPSYRIISQYLKAFAKIAKYAELIKITIK